MTRAHPAAICLALVCFWNRPVHADWLLGPLVGADVRSSSGFVDLEDTARDPHPVYGLSAWRVSDRAIGIEVEGTIAPGFFGGDDLVTSSRVTRGTARVLCLIPRSWLGTVRPYAVVGIGIVRNIPLDVRGLFRNETTLPAFSAGGGIWLPVNRRIGL